MPGGGFRVFNRSDIVELGDPVFIHAGYRSAGIEGRTSVILVAGAAGKALRPSNDYSFPVCWRR